jgi:hypothetical protein
MSPFAILGLAWMVSVALGIWVIAALLFLAELRQRSRIKHTFTRQRIRSNFVYLGAHRRPSSTW